MCVKLQPSSKYGISTIVTINKKNLKMRVLVSVNYGKIRKDDFDIMYPKFLSQKRNNFMCKTDD